MWNFVVTIEGLDEEAVFKIQRLTRALAAVVWAVPSVTGNYAIYPLCT